MRVLSALCSLLIYVLVGAVFVTLITLNRHQVTLDLGVITLNMPLYAPIAIALLGGLGVGIAHAWQLRFRNYCHTRSLKRRLAAAEKSLHDTH